jgi:hypothetical protein
MGAIATVITDKDKMGHKNVRYGTMTMSGSYATGGDSFAVEDLELITLDLLIVQPVKGGRIYEWDGGLKIKGTLPTKAQTAANTGATAASVGAGITLSGAPGIGTLAVAGAPAIGSLAVSGAPTAGTLAVVVGATGVTAGTGGISGAPGIGSLAVAGAPGLGSLAVSGAPTAGSLAAVLASGTATVPAGFRSAVDAGVGDEVTAATDLSAVVLGFMAFGI